MEAFFPSKFIRWREEERRRRDGNNRGGVKGVLTVEGLVFSKRPTQDLSIGKATG